MSVDPLSCIFWGAKEVYSKKFEFTEMLMIFISNTLFSSDPMQRNYNYLQRIRPTYLISSGTECYPLLKSDLKPCHRICSRKSLSFLRPIHKNPDKLGHITVPWMWRNENHWVGMDASILYSFVSSHPAYCL